MDKPFAFGVPVDGEYFIGREAEIRRLSTLFKCGINVVLMSPRRMGKTSLVKTVAGMAASKDLIIVQMDAYPCRSEYDFYNAFAESVIGATSSKIEEIARNAMDFIGRISPTISVSPDNTAEYSLSFGITPQTHTPKEILDLPEKIAERKNCRIVVCIDEFQQIGEYPESLAVQKRLRSAWQNHKKVSYCLYGSKMHMMNSLFQKKNSPFYKFGENMPLSSISLDDWQKYICERFALNGKEIPASYVERICEAVEYQSSYIQQLAWCILYNTEKTVGEDVFRQSLQDLIDQNTPVFIEHTEHLTAYQVNFLHAVADGITSGYGQEKIRIGYNLGAPSNIPRLKKALTDKDLIDYTLDGYSIADPVFKLWFKKTF